MRLIISIIIPLILSFGVCSIALNKTRRLSELALAASLTPMIAAAITSILLFFWILIIDSEQSLTKYLLAETIIFTVGIAASGFWWFKKGRGSFNNPKLSF